MPSHNHTVRCENGHVFSFPVTHIRGVPAHNNKGELQQPVTEEFRADDPTTATCPECGKATGHTTISIFEV